MENLAAQPHEALTFTSPDLLPIAGPHAEPQTVEIDVAPWQRISVQFRAVRVSRCAEAGSVWYWQPDKMTRLNR